MNPRERRRLLGDPRREAVDALDGYVFQIWHSLLAWLQLREGELLYLEGAEDADILRPGAAAAATIQIRRAHGSITLNSLRAVTAINHFWEHTTRNPEISITYRYLSTESISAERPPIDGLSRPGLVAWRDAQAENAALCEADVVAISDHLVANDNISEDLKSFLRAADPREIHERLIQRIIWETESAESSDIRSLVERTVGELGRERGFSGPQSLLAISRLLLRTLEVATNRDEKFRWLDRGELLDVFEQATTVPEGLFSEIPPLPPRFYHRASLYEEIEATLNSGNILLLVGSSGVGKTSTAVDYASRTNEPWARLDMRGLAPSEVTHLLRVALRTMPRECVNILIDDLPVDGDVRLYAWELSRFIDTVVTAGARVILTAYNELPRILSSSLESHSPASISVPMFTEADVAALLNQVGAGDGLSERWSRIIEATTSGHPTLVDARVQSLEERGFPAPTAEDLIEQPQAARDALDQARSIIAATLTMPARTLLYRLSLATAHPLRRSQIVTLGAAAIPADPIIEHPGEVTDRLIGPWLEPFGNERWRVSPLAFRSGEMSHDAAWIRAANASMARALLTDSPVDLYDGAASIIHCVLGEDADTLIRVLESFLRSEDGFWEALLRYQPIFPALAINTPPLPIFRNPLVTTMFRAAQYRAAGAAEDAHAAGLIVDAFEQSIQEDDYHAPLRVMFYSVVCGFAAEPALTLLRRVLAWIAAVDRAAASTNAIALAMAESLRGSTDQGDVGGQAGLLLLSRIEALEEFNELCAALRDLAPAVVRRLFSLMESEPAMWRSVVYTLILDQRARANPNYATLAANLYEFHELCLSIGSRDLAIEALASSIRLSAEFAEDPQTADIGVERGLALFGNVARLRLAEAASAHAAGDRERAIDLFRSALSELEYHVGDLEPAFDRRAAAIDAGALGLFDVASELLEASTQYATIELAPVLSVGLMFDAAYAAWRAGNEDVALRFARSAGDAILAMDPARDEPGYRNLTRRIGHVITHIAQGQASMAPPETLPFVGYASELEPLEDEAVTPVELIGVLIAEFEARMGQSPEWFHRHEERLTGTAYPIGAMALHAGAQWAMRRGEVSAFLDYIIAMHAQGEAEMARRGRPALPPRTFIDLTGAALIGRIAEGGVDAEALEQLLRIARAHGLAELVFWLELAVQYFSDFNSALSALRGEDHDDSHQFLAAILLPSSEALRPPLLLRATEVWVLHLAHGGEVYPFAEVLLRSMRRVWRIAIANMRIHLTAPMRTVPILIAALENEEGSEWDRIAQILRCAADCVGVQLWSRTVEVLEERSLGTPGR
jgi:hypothetical protein